MTPTVEVTFTPLPAHVRTARLVATAVARRSGVEEALLDEVRLAVGEACSRAVEAHRQHCPAEPIRIELTDRAGRFEVVVTDAAPVNGDERVRALTPGGKQALATPAGVVRGGRDSQDGAVSPEAGALGRVGQLSSPPDVASGSDSGLPEVFGLAVITGLADDVQISATDNGISVRMSWPTASPQH
jgi:anti-sigma regulatory factor (Ser/Thr protein kinase)